MDRRRYSDLASSSLAAVARIVTLASVMAMPWLFGGVQPAVKVWLVAGVALALSISLIAQLTGAVTIERLPWTAAVLMLAVGLGLVQSVALPEGALTRLSPTSWRQWNELLPQPQTAAISRALPAKTEDSTRELTQLQSARTATISLYPAETRRRVTLLATMGGLFLLGVLLFSDRLSSLMLFVLVAINGVALAFFGIVQQLVWNGMLYGTVSLDRGGAPFASFVNRNNAGGYLLLCLSCALGLTLWLFSRESQTNFHAMGLSARGNVGRWLLEGIRSAWESVLAFVGGLNARQLATLLATILLIGGILLSLSRGAWLAGIAALTVTLLVTRLVRSRQRRAWLPMIAILASLWFVGWLGQSDMVRDRFDTLLGKELASNEGRLKHWQDSLATARDYAGLGTGLGTYRFAYRAYQHRPDRVLFYHAENQYVEALVEGGVIGLALMLTAIGAMGWTCWYLLQHPAQSTAYACGLVGLFAIVGQAAHAFFDFGLSIPANASLMALLCGSVAGCGVRRYAAQSSTRQSSPHRSSRRSSTPSMASRRSPAQAAALTVAFLAVLLSGLPPLQAAVELRGLLRASQFQQDADAFEPSELDFFISEMGRQLADGYPSAESHQRLALLHLQRYRQTTWSEAGRRAENADQEALWKNTSPLSLHAWLTQLSSANRMLELEEFRADGSVRADLRTAVGHLHRARALCPVLPDPHLLLGELELVAEVNESSSVHLQRLRAVAGGDPQRLLEGGHAAYQAGDLPLAMQCWKRAASLDAQQLAGSIRFVLGRDVPPTDLTPMFPDSPSQLITAAREDFAGSEDDAIRGLLLQQAEALLGQQELAEDESLYLHGMILALQGANEQAVTAFNRAVQLSPYDARFRYELASVLGRQGQWEEAKHQASLCTRLAPDNQQYDSLLRGLIRGELTGDYDAYRD